MSTSPAPIRAVDVAVIDGALHVRDLTEPDSEVVKVVGDADDEDERAAGRGGAHRARRLHRDRR